VLQPVGDNARGGAGGQDDDVGVGDVPGNDAHRPHEGGRVLQVVGFAGRPLPGAADEDQFVRDGAGDRRDGGGRADSPHADDAELH
jgi:hypothetical protein